MFTRDFGPTVHCTFSDRETYSHRPAGDDGAFFCGDCGSTDHTPAVDESHDSKSGLLTIRVLSRPDGRWEVFTYARQGAPVGSSGFLAFADEASARRYANEAWAK